MNMQTCSIPPQYIYAYTCQHIKIHYTYPPYSVSRWLDLLNKCITYVCDDYDDDDDDNHHLNTLSLGHMYDITFEITTL